MNAAKRIIGLLLLLIISMPSLLLIFFKTHQLVVRHQMQEKLELANLETIQLPVQSVEWYEEDKEVIIKGQLFDVESYSIHNDTIILTGLFDEEETEIKKQVQLLLQQQNDENTDGESLLADFFSDTLYHHLLNKWTQHPGDNASLTFFLSNSGKISPVYLSLTVPPPEA
jgi:hypothetical protein